MTDVIQRELELPGSLDEAWRALTDPAWLQSWLADEVSLELWPGGDARFVIDGVVRGGWVEEVTAPAPGHRPGRSGRLAFWWQPDGGIDGSASRVSLEVEATDDGTRLRVVEARPLDVLDLVGVPLPGQGGASFGPALVGAR